ncbi:MAG: hypothetical protein HHJ10_08790 [Cellulomonas sp.]|uniref:hypothetical protein n=1 Tax=Cellulomonas sp. TaxID=40001 RepID=UPI00181FD4EB|nr:hypothetical protein [Cellulomonas sp.]NMM31121.1 hypothetical protein [Cellulomonas sp.]
MKRFLGVLAALLAVAAIGLTPASAAKLTLVGAQHPHASSYQRCDDAVAVTLTVTGKKKDPSTSAAITGIAASCSGLIATVYVYTSSTGAARWSASGTVASTSTSLTLAPNASFQLNTTDVAYVMIGAWPVPTNNQALPALWCTVAGGTGTDACDATVSIFTGTRGTVFATYYDVVVTTTSTTPVTWEVTFNLASSSYGTPIATKLGNSDFDAYCDGTTQWGSVQPAVNDVNPGTCTAGLLTVTGVTGAAPNPDFSTVTSTLERHFSLVINRTKPKYTDVLSSACS